MSTDSVGTVPTDEDSSDEEVRRCALVDMKKKKERNLFPFPPSMCPTSDTHFPSQSPMAKTHSGFFTKPSLVSKKVCVLLQSASVFICSNGKCSH